MLTTDIDLECYQHHLKKNWTPIICLQVYRCCDSHVYILVYEYNTQDKFWQLDCTIVTFTGMLTLGYTCNTIGILILSIFSLTSSAVSSRDPPTGSSSFFFKVRPVVKNGEINPLIYAAELRVIYKPCWCLEYVSSEPQFQVWECTHALENIRLII